MSDSAARKVGLDHILVLPGGGYRMRAPHEGAPVVDWLSGLGVTAEVVEYPLSTRHPRPLRAVRSAVADARAMGARRVGIVGFSAGGHAAVIAALAPGASVAERVDMVILGYPVVSMLTGAHRGSRQILLGEGSSLAQREATSGELLVTRDAPPFFVWHTAEDGTVPFEHTTRLAQALAAQGVGFELHIYESGAHGLGLAGGQGTAESWTTACAAWMRQRGWLSEPARGSAPKCCQASK